MESPLLKYKEEQRDLFSITDKCYFAHCISSDFAMGKGIALQFNHYFNIKKILRAISKKVMKNGLKNSE